MDDEVDLKDKTLRLKRISNEVKTQRYLNLRCGEKSHKSWECPHVKPVIPWNVPISSAKRRQEDSTTVEEPPFKRAVSSATQTNNSLASRIVLAVSRKIRKTLLPIGTNQPLTFTTRSGINGSTQTNPLVPPCKSCYMERITIDKTITDPSISNTIGWNLRINRTARHFFSVAVFVSPFDFIGLVYLKNKPKLHFQAS